MATAEPRPLAEVEPREWVAAYEWKDGMTPETSGYFWHLYLINPPPPDSDKVVLSEIEEGFALTKFGVKWDIWRARRRHGLKGKPNVSGEIP